MIGSAKGVESVKVAFAEEQKRVADLMSGYGDIDLIESAKDLPSLTPGGAAAKLVTKTLGLTEEEEKEKKDKITLSFAREELMQRYQQDIERAKSRISTAEDLVKAFTPRDMGLLEQGLRGGIQMTAEMAAPLAITMGTKGKINPMLPFITTKVAADSYGTAVNKGLSHEESLQYAVEQAAIEYVTERAPTKLLEKMGADIGGKGFKKKLRDWMVREFLGEQAATAGQTLSTWAHGLDEEIEKAKSWEEVLELQMNRQIVTGIATAVGGGSIAGGLGGLNYLAGRGDAANQAALKASVNRLESEESQSWLDDFISLSQSSKTNERSDEQFEEFVKTLDSEAQVYLSADIAGELEGAPQYIIDQLDGSGVDVSIPLTQFIADFIKDEARLNYVRPYIKIREDLQTQSEIGQDSDQVKTLLEKAEKDQAAKTEADQIYEKVKDQLVKTRRQGEQTAKLSAELIPAAIVAKQAELKSRGIEVGISELYEDVGLKIIGPGQELDKDFLTQEPELTATQELGDVEFTDYYTDEGGNRVEVKEKAQDVWDDTQERKSTIDILTRCMGG